MMRCMVECYDNEISNMGDREKELFKILSNCQQFLRELSQKEVVPEQNNAVQHQFITPLADEPTTTECCGMETSQDDLVSSEDFCTISCPSSEYPNEPGGCLEELTDCSAEPGEHPQNAKKLHYDVGLAGPMLCGQHSPSTYLAPDFPAEASHGPKGVSAAGQCGGKEKRSHHVLKFQASKDSASAQPIMDEKGETKKQKKMRKKKELQEMKELWMTMKQNRSDTTKGGSNITKSVVQPNYQDEVHKSPIWRAGGVEKPGRMNPRIADLEAALTAMLNDIESIQSFPSI
jgi:hypothetical protein